MEAIILAGGLGTRLRSVVADRPKALAPINDRPFLHLLLAMLANHGFRRIILATGYLSDQIRAAVGDSFAGMSITYSQEEAPLGTGGALAQAIKKVTNDHAFVLNGDTWLDINYAKVEELWQKQKKLIICGKCEQAPNRYGTLVLKDNRVIGFKEKQPVSSGWINAGCYIMPTNIMTEMKLPRKFSLEMDFLPGHLALEPAILFQADGSFYDIGTPGDYIHFCGFIKNSTGNEGK